MSLSADGKIIAIGALVNNNESGDYAGHARVYQMDDSDSIWKQLGQDIDGVSAGDLSGSSVSLSDDGKTLAIGATGNSDNGTYSGHVRVYQMDASLSSWKQIGQDINGESDYDQ